MSIPAEEEGREGVVPQVVFHGFTEESAAENGYGIGNIDGATNVTRYCTSVSWSHMLTEPYETISLEMVFPETVFQHILPGAKIRDGVRRASTGFWVVLYLPCGEKDDGTKRWSAIALGVCTGLRVRSVANPLTGVHTTQASVSCESWTGLLRRNSVFLAPGSNYINEGFSYDLATWADDWAALVKGTLNQAPGRTFATVFPAMAKILVPDTLLSGMGEYMDWGATGSTGLEYGDGAVSGAAGTDTSSSVKSKCYNLGDVVKVVYDRNSCAKYAPVRVLNHKSIPGMGIPSAGSVLPRGSTWSFFESTFFPTPHVECFPSLEWPHGLAGEEQASARQTVHDSPAVAFLYFEEGKKADPDLYYSMSLDEVLQATQISRSSKEKSWLATPWQVDSPSPFNGDVDHAEFQLGNALGGACPVIIYRMRPTMFFPINALTATAYLRAGPEEVDEDYYNQVAAPTASETVGLNQVTQVVSPSPNLGGNGAYAFTANEVFDVTWTFSEDDRANMVSVKHPWSVQSEFEDHVFSGVPVLNSWDVPKYGLRMKTVEWPFFPEAGAHTELGDEMQATLLDSLNCLHEELWTTLANTDHDQFHGKGTVKTRYKPTIKAGHYATFQWGEQFGDSVGGFASMIADSESDINGFNGYITRVTHSVMSNAVTGAITATTELTLERCSIASAEYDKVSTKFPVPSEIVELARPVFIDPETHEVIYGSVEVNDDGTVEFKPGSE